MSIQEITFDASPALEKELAFFATTSDWMKIYSDIKTKEDVVRWIDSNPDFFDLKWIVPSLKNRRILDVGVGWGMTTAYLAIHGVDVACVEPSLESCRNMHELFKRLGLDIQIFRGIAENMHEIKKQFNCVIFWSSLHHA